MTWGEKTWIRGSSERGGFERKKKITKMKSGIRKKSKKGGRRRYRQGDVLELAWRNTGA